MAENIDFEDEIINGFEEEDEIENITDYDYSNAVVFPTDWTTETIVNQISKGNIKLDPLFQRRDAWNSKLKSRFIESLILGFPIPQIVLAEQKDNKGNYIVVDGKQRLLTLCQFYNIEVESEGKLTNFGERLKLENLSIRKNLNNKTYESLKSDSSLQVILNSFQNQTIRTVIIKNWINDDFLFLLFHRINSGSLPLSPQELRQSLAKGEFVKFAESFTSDNKDFMKIFNKEKPDPRMRDVELFVRAIGMQFKLGEYNGSMKGFLDNTCEYLNKVWPQKENEIKRVSNSIISAIDLTRSIFDKDSFRKWNGNYYESQLNKSIFDVMIYYFSILIDKKDEIIKNKDEVQTKFKNLCSSDQEFLSTLERSTNTTNALKTRLSKWGTQLKSLNLIDEKSNIHRDFLGEL